MIFNELNGSEAKEILLQRFSAQLASIPWLLRHITLPRVRMKMSVTFELYADQPTPELHSIEDDFTIRTDKSSSPTYTLPHAEPHVFEAQEDIDSSSTGLPPDQLRDEHSLPSPMPVRDRITRQTADFIDEAVLTPGITIKRVRGDQPSPSSGATIVTQDFGSRVNRREEQPNFKNSARRDHNQEPMQKK